MHCSSCGDVGRSESHPLIYLRNISVSFHPCLTPALTFRNRLFSNKQPAQAQHEQTSSCICYTCPCWVLCLSIQRCFKCMWLNGCFPIQAFATSVSVFPGFYFARFVISLTSEFTGLTVRKPLNTIYPQKRVAAGLPVLAKNNL